MITDGLISPEAEAAIRDCLSAGKAILKFISRNDVGDTGGHQCGYYLPKHAWELFTTVPPEKGKTITVPVSVTWPYGRVTDSSVKWYGTGTRSEYRLTKFGRGFPWLDREKVGSLLVLIPFDYENFTAWVLETDDDIEGIQSALGIEVVETLAVYQRGLSDVETESECIDRRFREFAEKLDDYPLARLISDRAREALVTCTKDFSEQSPDKRLSELIDNEYVLFRLIERKLATPDVIRLFKDIDDFLATAQSILQRRKGRAGLSFQNHFEDLLHDEDIPFQRQPPSIEGKPDIVIPNEGAYHDPHYPMEKLFILALKTTCKDRWRQILEEAPRQPIKYLATLQHGISVNQLRLMTERNVRLVVPRDRHKDYNVKESGAALFDLASFVSTVRRVL